jgi:hypothetical protein
LRLDWCWWNFLPGVGQYDLRYIPSDRNNLCVLAQTADLGRRAVGQKESLGRGDDQAEALSFSDQSSEAIRTKAVRHNAADLRSLPPALRNSASRDVEPIRRSTSGSYGVVHQTKPENLPFLAPCSHRGDRCYEQEPFSLALLSGYGKHI